MRDVIQGPWLMEQMQKQAEHVGAQMMFDTIVEADLSRRPFRLVGDSGTVYVGDTLVIATGAQARWLGLESEQKLRGAGRFSLRHLRRLFLSRQEGGGDRRRQYRSRGSLYLTNHSHDVTLIHRRDSACALKKSCRSGCSLIRRSRSYGTRSSTNSWAAGTPVGLTGLKLRNIKTGEVPDFAAEGAFVAIGHSPATRLFQDKLDLDDEGYIQVETGTTRTSIPGVFACGDVQDKIYRQAVTAAGTGCMAALDAERFLEEQDFEARAEAVS